MASNPQDRARALERISQQLPRVNQLLAEANEARLRSGFAESSVRMENARGPRRRTTADTTTSMVGNAAPVSTSNWIRELFGDDMDINDEDDEDDDEDSDDGYSPPSYPSERLTRLAASGDWPWNSTDSTAVSRRVQRPEHPPHSGWNTGRTYERNTIRQRRRERVRLQSLENHCRTWAVRRLVRLATAEEDAELRRRLEGEVKRRMHAGGD